VIVMREELIVLEEGVTAGVVMTCCTGSVTRS